MIGRMGLIGQIGILLALLLALASAGQAADWDKIRAQDITLKARSGTAVTSISATTAGGLVLTPKAAAPVNIGVNGAGVQSLYLFGPTLHKYMAVYTQSGYGIIKSFGSGNTMAIASDGPIEINSGANGSFTSFIGGYWVIKDFDTAGYPNRLTLDSATGNLTLYGTLETGGASPTTRLAANGSATLTTTSIVSAGINNSSPKSPLHIKSRNANYDGSIVIEESATTNGWGWAATGGVLYFGYGPAQTPGSIATKATIDSSGNIDASAIKTSNATRIASTGAATLTTVTATNAISGPKTRDTVEGGRAVLVTNRTGGASVRGQVVAISASYDNAVETSAANEDFPQGVIYNAGVANGSEVWVVTEGIADVLFKDGVAPARDNVVYSSDTAGRADCAASLPSVTLHNREIGHCMEAKSSGSNVLAKCIMHYN